MSGTSQIPQRDIPAARPPVPPFSRETAIQKVPLIEDAWNSRDAEKMALAYTPDSRWRNRAEFQNGREQILEFLKRKYARELDYRLIAYGRGCVAEPISVPSVREALLLAVGIEGLHGATEKMERLSVLWPSAR